MKNQTNSSTVLMSQSKFDKDIIQIFSEQEISFFYTNKVNRNCEALVNGILQKNAVHFVFCNKKSFKINLSLERIDSFTCEPNNLSLIYNKQELDSKIHFEGLEEQEISILSISDQYFKKQTDSKLLQLFEECYFNQNISSGFIPNFYKIENEDINIQIQKIKNYLSVSNENNLLIKAALYQLKFLFCEYFLVFYNDATISPGEMEKIRRIPQIVRKYLETPVDKFTLSNYLGITVDKLEYGCRKLFNCEITQKINDIRINSFCDLVKNHKLNIAHAAYKTGFVSRHDLYTSFNKKFSLNPQAWVKKFC